MSTSRSSRLTAHSASPRFVESKVDYLADVHVWPERQVLDPRGWLDNFRPSERPFAFNMLNVFLYYNELLINALFLAAVQQLSVTITANATNLAEAKQLWSDFLTTLLITYVEGETPSPTDSGYVFARKARQVLGIHETSIVAPHVALAAVALDPAVPVLFVDDFVGSGSQFVRTWQRPYHLIHGIDSFASASQRGASISYTPLIATHYGLTNILDACKSPDVRPGHVLADEYCLASDKSILWPPSLQADAQTFLFDVSQRAGIVADLGDAWTGFHGLALPLAFSHSVPDATLPLYYWRRSDWKPLVRRS